ncbi:MAG TPA: M20/M25/M40 family metallo-hydrolase [Solirubrobacteraceae bacterium]|nr:M20/M25/M40 family metallo-hydrolase [Solirubrobacteraceae bacterium]
MSTREPQLQDRPLQLLQQLLRFDTSNPPGAEGECIAWIAGLLGDLGCEVRTLADASGRPNLLARLAGRGAAPPLLLQGHIDVVAARGEWLHPPFGGEVHDGYVWGRGALDMKGGVAMMLAAFMRATASDVQPPGDVILCVLADEEAGSDHGAEFLVREHPELFAGVRHSIGEFGGFTMQLAGRRFYPIMVAEKQVCWTRAAFRGAAGHGSMPVRGSAMGKLGALLRGLDRRRLPVHVTPVVDTMVGAIADEVPAPLGLPLRGLLKPALTDRLLDVLGERGRVFDPLLHNTASVTIVAGGEKINVIPGEVSVEIDCRLLPGQSPDDVFAELRALAGVEIELEVIRYDEGAAQPDLALFDTLAGTLRELDPSAKPIPLLLPGVTDGRFFSRLGIQTYGFLPMQLPADMPFMQLIHAENERLPVDAVEFGTRAIGRVLERFV